jgi:hypothetical protein
MASYTVTFTFIIRKEFFNSMDIFRIIPLKCVYNFLLTFTISSDINAVYEVTLLLQLMDIADIGLAVQAEKGKDMINKSYSKI